MTGVTVKTARGEQVLPADLVVVCVWVGEGGERAYRLVRERVLPADLVVVSVW